MTVDTFSSPSKPYFKLEARTLCCVRGERRLFQDLNLTVSSGECLHVRGENGVGKTSLLRLLTGLSTPEVGEILWNGQLITKDVSS
jgi:heme exporter protein A